MNLIECVCIFGVMEMVYKRISVIVKHTNASEYLTLLTTDVFVYHPKAAIFFIIIFFFFLDLNYYLILGCCAFFFLFRCFHSSVLLITSVTLWPFGS